MLKCIYLPKQKFQESTGDIHSSAEVTVLMLCVCCHLNLKSKLFKNGKSSTSVLTRIAVIMSYE
jgi:hypothetical protein